MKSLSVLIRVGMILLAIFAVVSSFAMVSEWISFAKSAPDSAAGFRSARLFALVVVNLVMTVLLVGIALLYFWMRAAKSLPELCGWHTDRPASEFCAADAIAGYTLDDYLRQEQHVFDELSAFTSGPWRDESSGNYCRYNEDSICYPNSILEHNWNRSYIREHPHPVAGVLLLHGLSDSPYSLRAIGQRLYEEGFTVVWLRIPGHGTNPGSLAAVSSADWSAAVKVAAKGLKERLPSDLPIVLGGYSNGGALSVEYTLTALDDDSLPMPQAVILFSPMIGINPLARITWLYHMVALVSRNKKAQWSSIFAEIDPFKYSSWPMNANVQAWDVTQSVERKLADLHSHGRVKELPPVMAMQSVVDSTVVVPKLITVLFDRLESSSSELVLFNVDRSEWIGDLLNYSFEKSIVPKLQRTDRPYRLVVLKNSNQNSEQLLCATRDGQDWSEEPVDMVWPEGMLSLSHVAVPFPPHDPVYGDGQSTDTPTRKLTLGTVSIRSEPSALMIPSSVFTRCRHNPFYHWMEERIIAWLANALDKDESQVE